MQPATSAVDGIFGGDFDYGSLEVRGFHFYGKRLGKLVFTRNQLGEACVSLTEVNDALQK